MPELIVSTTGLTRQYSGHTVVDGLTLSVARGRAFGLLGPNGAGKTTTVRLLNGLVAPSSGSIEVFGETLSTHNADRLRSRVGVQTDTEVYATLTARENLTTWGELYGVARNRLHARVSDVLEIMRLTDRANSMVGGFSKGMRQKVAVGRAIIHEPELLYLDEPTAGLDPEATQELIGYLSELVRTTGTTLVICTHQLHGLQTLVDDVGILVSGQMAATGSVAGLINERWPRPTVSFSTTEPAAALQVLNSMTTTQAHLAHDDVVATVESADVIAQAVRELVARGIGVLAVQPVQRSIHDLYFATINDQRGTDEAAKEVAA